MNISMLTTVDNPYDPFTEFDLWNAYDISMGYNTSSYLARIAAYSPELSEIDQEQSIQTAIDEILLHNLTGLYRCVKKDDPSFEKKDNPSDSMNK